MLDRKLKEYKVQNNDSVSVKNVCKHCSFNEQPVFKRKRRSQQNIVDTDFIPERVNIFIYFLYTDVITYQRNKLNKYIVSRQN